MARTFTLEQLRDRVRQAASIVYDGDYISDDELTSYINESISELYDLIMDNESGEVFVKNHPLTTLSGSFAHSLWTDFYKLCGVHYYDGEKYHPLSPTDPRSYAELAVDDTIQPERGFYYLRFDPSTGDKYLYVFPSIQPAKLAITYMPNAPYLVYDNDVWDGFNGWEEYAVASAAIKCLEKQQRDTAALQIRLDRLAKRIRAHSSYFDTGMPDVIKDVANARGYLRGRR